MSTNEKIAVVLLNLGGPDSPEAVQPFLFNLFNDPDIINFPLSFLFRKRLAKIISTKRSPKIIDQYKQIGGKSPLLDLTIKQSEALQTELRTKIDCSVYMAMRYWKPFTEETMRRMKKDEITKIVLLPLYPHYSISTTGSSYNEWKRLVKIYKYFRSLDIRLVKEYFDFPAYIDSLVESINKTLLRFPENELESVVLLFSAHGTPVKLFKQGDPYKYHIESTVKEVMSRGAFKQKHFLSFQSKVGPQKWLEPKTPDTIEKLAAGGEKFLLIIPVAFVSDHLETLYEIGIEFRHLAEEKGIIQFEVMPGLNDSPLFIKALAELVLNSLNGEIGK
ncbi:MAG: ferrochelatase [Ignavibacteria bacterium]